jgi:hypothetical protein
VNTLWRDVKVALTDKIAAYRGCCDDGIQCGETPTGGFAGTQFRKPLAFMDVTLDSDNGLVACVYTFRTDDDAPYQEGVRILLVTERDTTLFLSTQEGQLLETSDAAAQDLLTPYLARLTCEAASFCTASSGSRLAGEVRDRVGYEQRRFRETGAPAGR